MWRTALRPRWLALLAVVLLAATGMSWLGRWQLERAQQRGTAAEQRRLDGSPRPLPEVLRARRPFPGSAADARVVASGSWDGGRQLLVAGRRIGDATGFWVLTPLRLADGSAVPVVRGWVPSAGDPAVAAPTGQVEVTGTLRPAEPPADAAPGAGSGLPAGQIARVDVTVLVQRWPYPLLTGYLVQSGQQPPAAAPAPRPVPAQAPAGIAWRNVSYAVQWWLFAAFGLFLWWRVVRDDHVARAATTPGPGAGPGVRDDGATHPPMSSGARP